MFADKGMWHFETREGKVEGPYIDKDQAKRAMDIYVRVMSSKFAPTTEFTLVEDEEHKAPRGPRPKGENWQAASGSRIGSAL